MNLYIMKKLLIITLFPFLLISCFGGKEVTNTESEAETPSTLSPVVENLPLVPTDPSVETISDSWSTATPSPALIESIVDKINDNDAAGIQTTSNTPTIPSDSVTPVKSVKEEIALEEEIEILFEDIIKSVEDDK